MYLRPDLCGWDQTSRMQSSMTFYSPIPQYGSACDKECFELVFRYCEHCKGSVTFEDDPAEYGGHSTRSQQLFSMLEAQVSH
jgi:hypothetical protein